MTDHGWLTADTPKPRTAPEPRLANGKHRHDTRPIGLASLRLSSAQHARCVDHVDVQGLKDPVCILPGQAKDDVAREARALAGLPAPEEKHRAELVKGSKIGSHGLCVCGRILQDAGSKRSRVDGSVVARGGWRHVSNPTSTMIPEKLRKAAR